MMPTLDARWTAAALQLGVAVVLDALDGLGLTRQAPRIAMPSRGAPGLLVGRARTTLWLEFAHDDPATYELELKAVDGLAAGDVLVAAAGGSRRSGIWGELLTTAAMRCGAVGMVTDGAIRDVRQIGALGFKTYAQHLSPYDSYNRQKVVAVDVPVEIDGVAIASGDVILADDDGVCIVPAAHAEATLARALAKLNDENAFRDAVRAGMPAWEAYSRFKVL